ncbi:hypothetical protein TcG_12460 [Trypanosoma cruzi]|nr:hypothetical protein TcG_12460 [Trypanosoma cruzi]
MSCGTVAHDQRRQERTLPPPQAAWRLSFPTTRHRQRGSAAALSRFPDVTVQRVLRVSQWTSTPLHGVGPPSFIVYCRDGGRHPGTERHAAMTERCCLFSA